MAPLTNPCYRFGPYRLDPTDRLLYRDTDAVPLPPKVFDTLLIFVTSSGRVLSKEALLKQLWPDTFVEEGTLTQYISLLRKALGENGQWIENLPKRGYRFTASVEECVDSPTPEGSPATSAGAVPQRPARLRWLVAVGCLAVLAIALAAIWRNYSNHKPMRAIAVLPFVNLSGNADLEYISDGLTDELTNSLMRLRGLDVAARTSAFQFRGRNEDVREIGRKLNVSGVLEGSLRIEQNRIRVTAQLVDTRTGYQVWSDTFEGPRDDLLQIQQRITSAAAGALKREVHLPESPAGREVFLSYLEGRYFLAKGRPATFSKAAELFKGVIAREPNYARAHAGLADTYYRWALWENFPPREAFAIARQAAEQALALDNTLSEAHASRANVAFQYEWNFAAAEREFRKSIELDPRRADTWHWFSHLLMAMGRVAESIDASKTAIELEPFDLPSQNHLGWCYYFAGDYDRAIEQHRRVLEMDPAHGQTRLLLGRALLQKSMHREGIEELRRNLELSPGSPERLAAVAQAYAMAGDRHSAEKILEGLLASGKQKYVSAYSVATIHAALGSRREALAFLEKAADERSSRIVEIKTEPVFRSLRTEPAFRAIVSRIGL
jgi:TolB-like protein/DNA-binding winged helix-turn-helix (wHTH) protein/Tfp pilus assembly protein PilF